MSILHTTNKQTNNAQSQDQMSSETDDELVSAPNAMMNPTRNRSRSKTEEVLENADLNFLKHLDKSTKLDLKAHRKKKKLEHKKLELQEDMENDMRKSFKMENGKYFCAFEFASIVNAIDGRTV